MGEKKFTVLFTENELIAIERALEHSNANTNVQRNLLTVFRTAELGAAARSAWRKVGKAQRNVATAVGKRPEDFDDSEE